MTDIVKYAGCTFDGLIGTTNSGVEADANPKPSSRLELFDEYNQLLSRSRCIYINRAIDTWNSIPDFDQIVINTNALFSRGRAYLIGEFVAESIPLRGEYSHNSPFKEFHFEQMCETIPSEHAYSCRPSFNRSEYYKYVTYLLKQSIDVNIQVFLFGNVGLTDPKGTVETSNLLKAIEEARKYAKSKSLTAIFIAQNPSSFGGRAYLDRFDLLQGGVYSESDGSIPNTSEVLNKGTPNPPERLWLVQTRDGKPFYDLKKLVVEYDWFGSPLDDISEIACLSVQSSNFLQNVRLFSEENCLQGHLVGSAVSITATNYEYFKNLGIGFWLPGRQPIAFPPWIYTPLNLALYQNVSRYSINFNNEALLSLGNIRGGTKFTLDKAFPLGNHGFLVQQLDGNFCFYGENSWCSMALGEGNMTEFSTEGNIIQYSANGDVLWQSGTSGRGIYIEILSGRLSVVDEHKQIIWSAP